MSSTSMFAIDDTFRINGKISVSYNDALVTLFTFVGNEIRSVDSTYVKDGQFFFEGPEYVYEESLVSVGNYPDTVLYADVYLKGDISIYLKSKSVVSSLFYDEYKSFCDSTNVIYRSTLGVTDEEINKKLWEKLWKFRFGFKKRHINDGLGRELFIKDAMQYSGREIDIYAGKLYDLFSETDKNRDDVKKAYTLWNSMKERSELIGTTFTNYNFIDKDGKSCKISDYVGKYDLLLIDFWASWCGPCIAMEPNLKKLSEKYGDKGFGILAISLDNNRQSWLKHINKDKREWSNDACILSPDDEKKIRETYKIVGIPHWVLIDKNGKIIYLGEPFIEFYLKSIFENN